MPITKMSKLRYKEAATAKEVEPVPANHYSHPDHSGVRLGVIREQ